MGRPGPAVSFHTPGSRLSYGGSYIIIDQAYVQYIPPVASQDAYLERSTPSIPILFIHGGGLTGAMWESTPDRRPGWAILATRPPFGRPVYCIDAVDSGRSQCCPESAREAAVEYRTAEQMHERFRLGPYEGSQFPIERLDRLVASQSARRRGQKQYYAEAKGIRDAIAEIGRCDVIAHSNGCSTCVAALLDERTRSMIRRFVMIEPASPVTEPLNHLETTKTLLVWGDHLSGHEMWEPILEHYKYMKGAATHWDLPSRGIEGNSHFPMLDRNSDEIGTLVLEWLGYP